MTGAEADEYNREPWNMTGTPPSSTTGTVTTVTAVFSSPGKKTPRHKPCLSLGESGWPLCY